MRKIAGMVLTAAFTVPMLMPVWAAAAEANTSKEEVVYANLNANGSTEEINVVNIFGMEKEGQIIDYGEYESLRNMTTTDKINYQEDTVKIDTKARKLYYEGKLKTKELPWNISVHYFIDGKEYTPDKIAGMSGALKITMDITDNSANTANAGNFFDSYALQASVTLDANKCSNIAANGATVANVGSDKQLTYTILPGKGASEKITADVVDFEMEGISINGIPLDLDMEIDDEDLMDQVTDLLDAIEELDDGTGELQDGISNLQDGVKNDLKNGTERLSNGAGQLQSGAGKLVKGGKSLQSGADSLNSGVSTLDSGVQSLNNGIAQVQAGLDALNEKSDSLTSGSAQMKEVLQQLQSALNGVNTTAEEIETLTSTSAQIKQAVTQLASGAEKLQDSVSYKGYQAAMSQKGIDVGGLESENSEAISSINSMLGQVETAEALAKKMGISSEAIAPWKSKCTSLANELIALLKKNNASLAGTEAYLNGVSDKAASLAENAENLQEKYTQFDGAIDELADTLSDLIFKTSQLKDAVNTLVEEYSKLDEGLNAYTDGVGKVAAGYKQVSSGAAELAAGSKQLTGGSESLYSGTSELLNGLVELYDASGTLTDGAGQLDEGAAELLAGVAQLYSGCGELKDGTSAMREETTGMDDKIQDKVDSLLENVTGEDAEVVSFVSDKNTNVDAVQFVIQGEAIEVPEEKAPETQEEEQTSFWSKILNIFGKES